MCKTRSLQHGCSASWHAPLAERFTIILCTIARTFSRRIVVLVTLYSLYSCPGMLLSYVVIICRWDFSSEKFFPWDRIEICSLPKQRDMIHLRCRSSCSSSGASPSVAWPSQRCQADVGAGVLSDTSSHRAQAFCRNLTAQASGAKTPDQCLPHKFSRLAATFALSISEILFIPVPSFSYFLCCYSFDNLQEVLVIQWHGSIPLPSDHAGRLRLRFMGSSI